MPDKPEAKEEVVPIALKRFRSSNFSILYANSVQISPTKWDVQLVFERIIAPMTGTTPDAVDVEQLCAVVMSYEVAGSFLELLKRQLEAAKSTGPDLTPDEPIKS